MKDPIAPFILSTLLIDAHHGRTVLTSLGLAWTSLWTIIRGTTNTFCNGTRTAAQSNLFVKASQVNRLLVWVGSALAKLPPSQV